MAIPDIPLQTAASRIVEYPSGSSSAELFDCIHGIYLYLGLMLRLEEELDTGAREPHMRGSGDRYRKNHHEKDRRAYHECLVVIFTCNFDPDILDALISLDLSIRS
jgi:hypothetical protein